MYTILVNDDNTLVTSVRERIMQHSKLMNSLRFLVNPKYEIDTVKYDNTATETSYTREETTASFATMLNEKSDVES